MEQFYIDRQFGVAIWIEVEKGIVQKISNERPKYVAKMEEHYKGKSISFLKEDFIEKMKPTFHCVHNSAVTSAMLQVQSKKTQVRQLWNQISSLETPDELKEELRVKVGEIQIEQYACEKNLEDEKVRVSEEHGFSYDITRQPAIN